MIVVTGGAGFIGSNIIGGLNQCGIRDILVADRLDASGKWRNLTDKHIADYVDKDLLFDRIATENVEAIIHMGARTDTMEQDARLNIDDNYEYSKILWDYCARRKVQFIFASSASVYGNGKHGFREDIDLWKATPLNPYAFSKLLFDRWVLSQQCSPPSWAGLRFFNVYGPGEVQKGRMASVVYHAYHQVKQNGEIRLFKSYRPDVAHGEQKRDFIYVKDIADIVVFLINQKSPITGFYNIGTGHARSFNELALEIFHTLQIKPQIEYIEMPEGLESQYQYYTEADLTKLREIGYLSAFTSLEQGIQDYIRYL